MSSHGLMLDFIRNAAIEETLGISLGLSLGIPHCSVSLEERNQVKNRKRLDGKLHKQRTMIMCLCDIIR